jgi:radical SAM superfamily enzyme YgiQ (UPF0313 family)
MQYDGTIIRPPSEADSIILQVTIGCSHNHCTFCGAYKGTRFRIREDELLDADIAFAAKYCVRQKRVFLADGDALVLPHEKLVALLNTIRDKLPHVSRVSMYGNAKAIRSKNIAELKELKALGLDRIYMGLESGQNDVLLRIRKGETAQTMVESSHKIRDSGLFLSVTALLGIGGVELSEQHAEATGRILSLMAPRQIAALTLMPLPNTPLFREIEQGLFRLPDAYGILKELKILIEAITLDRVQFHANHASNHLPLSGRLQKDKSKMLHLLNSALSGCTPLVPDRMRAL